MRHPRLDEILARLRSYLEDLYSDRLSQVILYGSQARGDAHEESDIDVLVVLKGSLDYVTEVKRISYVRTDFCLEYGVLGSVVVAKVQQVESAEMPFYMNVRREGIAV